MRLSCRHSLPPSSQRRSRPARAPSRPLGAGAAGVTVSVADANPVAISPGSPPALRNLLSQAIVTPDLGRATPSPLTGPGGRLAAPPVTCADGAQPSTLQVAYRGNGGYGVTLTTFAATDTACAAPIGPGDDPARSTIAGRVVFVRVSRFLLRDPGSASTRARRRAARQRRPCLAVARGPLLAGAPGRRDVTAR